MTPTERERNRNFLPNEELLRKRLKNSPAKQGILDYLRRYGIEVEDFFSWPEKGGFYLSDLGILRHFLAGNIVIHPFNIENLTPNSYEVSLGRYFYRQEAELTPRRPRTYKSPIHYEFASSGREEPEEELPMFNPFDIANIKFIWRKCEAVQAGEFKKKHEVSLEGIEDDAEIIVINPHEMVLGHTQEFIGGRNIVSTMISARSSVGRSMLEVCNDANLGHLGFINRWTLEIKNKGDFAIPLIVGERYAQISFLETEPSAQSYQGQFQKGFDVEEVIRSWTPEKMLARMSRRHP